MKCFLFILCGFIVSIQAVYVEEMIKNEWLEYKFTYNKSYNCPEQEKMRLKIFLENRNEIAKHNQLYAEGSTTFHMGINEFSDWLPSEVNDRLLGYKKPVGVAMPRPYIVFNATGDRISDAKDWRKKGVVTKVKNQYPCGSCWAFSATGALEAHYAIKTGKLVSLSEQNLVDCSYSNHGCEGGDQGLAFLDIARNHGIDSESSYPYEGEQMDCRFNPSTVAATDKGYKSIAENERALTEAIDRVGPISVSIFATDKFQHYSGGIYNEPDCSQTDLNHSVLVVGYGSEEGHDYYIVKNSWGAWWGEGGYVRMSRNMNNQCGIANEAIYPIV